MKFIFEILRYIKDISLIFEILRIPAFLVGATGAGARFDVLPFAPAPPSGVGAVLPAAYAAKESATWAQNKESRRSSPNVAKFNMLKRSFSAVPRPILQTKIRLTFVTLSKL